MLFTNIVLPVFLIVLAGFLLEKSARLDFRTLTTTALYLLAPALVFSALTRREIEGDLTLSLFLFMVLYTAALVLTATVAGRLFGMDRETGAALTLTTAMMNVGNFGLPLTYFAFGETGLEVSILVFVLFNTPLGTLAVVIAQGPGAALGAALRNTLKIPLFHAVVAAFLLKALGVSVPEFLLRPLELLGQAAIPLMLLLLGMQLARTRLKVVPGFLALATALRLLLSPLVAWGLTALLDLHGLTRAVVILQTSTPAAVLPLLYSLRFGTRPDLVAGAIFVTTLLSSVSLTVLLYLLQ